MRPVPITRYIVAICLAAALLLPGLIVGCAGDTEPAAAPAAQIQNSPTITTTNDPGADKAFDRGIPDSAKIGGSRNSGIGSGYSGTGTLAR